MSASEERQSPKPLILENLPEGFLRYLNVLAGNLIALGGYGEIKIEFAEGKPKHTWMTMSHKAGWQFSDL